MVAEKQPGVGLVSATDHRKQPGEAEAENEKKPGSCTDCRDCGECTAAMELIKLRRQNSLVIKLGRRSQELLAKTLTT